MVPSSPRQARQRSDPEGAGWLQVAIAAQERERDRQLSSRDLTTSDLADIAEWHNREVEFLKSLRLILLRGGMDNLEWRDAGLFEAKKAFILAHLTPGDRQKLKDTDPIRGRPDDWLWRDTQ